MHRGHRPVSPQGPCAGDWRSRVYKADCQAEYNEWRDAEVQANQLQPEQSLNEQSGHRGRCGPLSEPQKAKAKFVKKIGGSCTECKIKKRGCPKEHFPLLYEENYQALQKDIEHKPAPAAAGKSDYDIKGAGSQFAQHESEPTQSSLGLEMSNNSYSPNNHLGPTNSHGPAGTGLSHVKNFSPYETSGLAANLDPHEPGGGPIVARSWLGESTWDRPAEPMSSLSIPPPWDSSVFSSHPWLQPLASLNSFATQSLSSFTFSGTELSNLPDNLAASFSGSTQVGPTAQLSSWNLPMSVQRVASSAGMPSAEDWETNTFPIRDESGHPNANARAQGASSQWPSHGTTAVGSATTASGDPFRRSASSRSTSNKRGRHDRRQNEEDDEGSGGKDEDGGRKGKESEPLRNTTRPPDCPSSKFDPITHPYELKHFRYARQRLFQRTSSQGASCRKNFQLALRQYMAEAEAPPFPPGWQNSPESLERYLGDIFSGVLDIVVKDWPSQESQAADPNDQGATNLPLGSRPVDTRTPIEGATRPAAQVEAGTNTPLAVTQMPKFINPQDLYLHREGENTQNFDDNPSLRATERGQWAQHQGHIQQDKSGQSNSAGHPPSFLP